MGPGFRPLPRPSWWKGRVWLAVGLGEVVDLGGLQLAVVNPHPGDLSGEDAHPLKQVTTNLITQVVKQAMLSSCKQPHSFCNWQELILFLTIRRR